MNERYIRDRISTLRTKQGISEYKMSLDLGHSKSYMQSISSGRSLPSLSEFLYICEYLGVTPMEFFDTETNEPEMINRLTGYAKKLTPKDLSIMITLAERLQEK